MNLEIVRIEKKISKETNDFVFLEKRIGMEKKRITK